MKRSDFSKDLFHTHLFIICFEHSFRHRISKNYFSIYRIAVWRVRILLIRCRCIVRYSFPLILRQSGANAKWPHIRPSFSEVNTLPVCTVPWVPGEIIFHDLMWFRKIHSAFTLNSSTRARVAVQALMEIWKLGKAAQARFASRPSATKTSLFPSGNMMWSTLDLTWRPEVKSTWPEKENRKWTYLLPGDVRSLQAEHVDLGVGMAHVGQNRSGFHLFHVLAGNDLLVSGCSHNQVNLRRDVLDLHHSHAFHCGL